MKLVHIPKSNLKDVSNIAPGKYLIKPIEHKGKTFNILHVKTSKSFTLCHTSGGLPQGYRFNSENMRVCGRLSSFPDQRFSIIKEL